MRSKLVVASFFAALGLVACSSSSSNAPPAEAGSTACTDSIVNVFNNNSGVACPVDSNGNPASYDTAITTTCDSANQKKGDIQYGPCLDYLVWEVDLDSSGNNLTKCYYDVTTHDFVGVIYGDGQQDQCGGSSSTVQAGTVDSSCHISGFTGGGAGAGFQSCTPSADAGAESSLLGQ